MRLRYLALLCQSVLASDALRDNQCQIGGRVSCDTVGDDDGELSWLLQLDRPSAFLIASDRVAADEPADAESEQAAACGAELHGGIGGLRARLGRAQRGFRDVHELCSKERGHLKKKVARCKGRLGVGVSDPDTGTCVEAVAAHRSKEDECNVLSIPASTTSCAYMATLSGLCQGYSQCMWGDDSEQPAVQRCATILMADGQGDEAPLVAQAAAELHRCRDSACEAVKEPVAETLCTDHSVSAVAWQPPPVTWDIDKTVVKLSVLDVDGLVLLVRCAGPNTKVTLDVNTRGAHGQVGLLLEGNGQQRAWNTSGIHGWPVMSTDHWTGPSPVVVLDGFTARLTLRSPAIDLDLQGMRLDPPNCKVESAVLPDASRSGTVSRKVDPLELVLRYKERMLVEVLGGSVNPFFLMLGVTAVGLFAIVGCIWQFMGSLTKGASGRLRH